MCNIYLKVSLKGGRLSAMNNFMLPDTTILVVLLSEYIIIWNHQAFQNYFVFYWNLILTTYSSIFQFVTFLIFIDVQGICSSSFVWIIQNHILSTSSIFIFDYNFLIDLKLNLTFIALLGRGGKFILDFHYSKKFLTKPQMVF